MMDKVNTDGADGQGDAVASGALDSGAEERGEPSSEGVVISEQFQKALYELLEDASMEELQFASNCANEKRYELEQAKREEEAPELSTEGMPSD